MSERDLLEALIAALDGAIECAESLTDYEAFVKLQNELKEELAHE